MMLFTIYDESDHDYADNDDNNDGDDDTAEVNDDGHGWSGMVRDSVFLMITIDSDDQDELRARFSSHAIAFLTGHAVAHYVHSLTTLTVLTNSAALCFATLTSFARIAPFIAMGLLAHSFCSLPRRLVEIPE